MLPGGMGCPMDVPLKSRLISLLAVVLGGSAAKSLHSSAKSCRPMQGQRSCPQLGLINRLASAPTRLFALRLPFADS